MTKQPTRQRLPHPVLPDILEDFDAFKPVGQQMVQTEFSLGFGNQPAFGGPASQARSWFYGNKPATGSQARLFARASDLQD